MRGKLEVYVQGQNQLSILGSRKDSSEAKVIQAWLANRSDVVRVEQRKTTGTIVVQYQCQGRIAGAFVRSVKEKLHVLQTSKNESIEIKAIHSLDGRVRYKLEGLNNSQIVFLSTVAASCPGVKKTQRLSGSDTILVSYDPNKVTEEFILNVLREANLSQIGKNSKNISSTRWGGALASTSVLILCMSRVFPLPVMAIGIALVSLRPLRRSIEVLIHEKKCNIDALDVAATVAALATGRPATAAFVIWMVGVGDLLLDISSNSTRNALSKLIHSKELEVCRLLPDGTSERVLVEKLQLGDRFLVQTGQSIAADGRVVSGTAEVDEKALTGESHLVSKKESDRVFASTIVVEGRLVVEVEVIGANSEAAKIEKVLSTVGNKPLTLQREALEFGGKLVPPTFGIAGIAATLASSVTPAVCVLITDFGTGIRISVPTSALTAMTIAAREGILVKGAQYLERLSKTDVIIFDKTGTLTRGLPEIVEVLTTGRFDEFHLIQLSASAESNQEHPVAKALRSYAKKLGAELLEPEPEAEEYSVGLGLTSKVSGFRVQVGRASWMEGLGLNIEHFNHDLARLQEEQISTLCVAIDGHVVGVVGYSDGTRPESAAIVQKLRAHGKRRVVLLSGDNSEVVQKVARDVGIDEAVGSLLPEQKADYIRKLKEKGHVVAMVGDGINDAPALALADVGISIAGSTEVAIETADVILLEGGLLRLPKAFAVSDQAIARVKQNLGVILVPNALAIFLGAFSLITPMVAALLNNGATMAAILIGTMPLLWTPDRRQRYQSQEGVARDSDDSKKNIIRPKKQKLQRHLRPVLSMPEILDIESLSDEGVFVRFEEKFFLPKKNGAQFKTEIQKFLKLSSPVPGTEFTDIESVYLDSPDFEIYQMHFSSLQERFKLRARRYAPNGISGDGSAHLEYKSKKEGVSRKVRFQVGKKEFELLWNGHILPASSRSLGMRNPDLQEGKLKDRVNWVNTLVSRSQLRPSCIVRYRREAFESKNLRLTLDDQIAFETTRSFSGMRSLLDSNPELTEAATRMRSTYLKGEYLLVEVKHPWAVPSWLTEILSANSCQRAKFSKYCYSVTEALLSES